MSQYKIKGDESTKTMSIPGNQINDKHNRITKHKQYTGSNKHLEGKLPNKKHKTYRTWAGILDTG